MINGEFVMKKCLYYLGVIALIGIVGIICGSREDDLAGIKLLKHEDLLDMKGGCLMQCDTRCDTDCVTSGSCPPSDPHWGTAPCCEYSEYEAVDFKLNQSPNAEICAAECTEWKYPRGCSMNDIQSGDPFCQYW